MSQTTTSTPGIFPTEGDGHLNPVFASIPCAVFPPLKEKIYIARSDALLEDVLKQMIALNIRAAPVLDVKAPADSHWPQKYIGIIDSIAMVCMVLDHISPEASSLANEVAISLAARRTTPADMALQDRWGPFIPVDSRTSSLLDAMVLLGKYGVRRLPVIDSHTGDITNMITQSGMLQVLYANIDRFDDFFLSRSIEQLGLVRRRPVFSVTVHQTMLDAFKLMRDKNISAVPVVGGKPEAPTLFSHVSDRDIRSVLLHPTRYEKLTRPFDSYITHLHPAINCRPHETLLTVLNRLVESRIHHIYVVSDTLELLDILSLREIVAIFVKEPEDSHFAEYFS